MSAKRHVMGFFLRFSVQMMAATQIIWVLHTTVMTGPLRVYRTQSMTSSWLVSTNRTYRKVLLFALCSLYLTLFYVNHVFIQCHTDSVMLTLYYIKSKIQASYSQNCHSIFAIQPSESFTQVTCANSHEQGKNCIDTKTNRAASRFSLMLYGITLNVCDAVHIHNLH